MGNISKILENQTVQSIVDKIVQENIESVKSTVNILKMKGENKDE